MIFNNAGIKYQNTTTFNIKFAAASFKNFAHIPTNGINKKAKELSSFKKNMDDSGRLK